MLVVVTMGCWDGIGMDWRVVETVMELIDEESVYVISQTILMSSIYLHHTPKLPFWFTLKKR